MPSQEVVQLVRTTPNETEVTSSNPPPPSCVDMSKQKNKKNKKIPCLAKFGISIRDLSLF
jgi:hypothetical protein